MNAKVKKYFRSQGKIGNETWKRNFEKMINFLMEESTLFVMSTMVWSCRANKHPYFFK
jgi:hypothetical protein